MTGQTINGYGNPRFTLNKGGKIFSYDLSFKYQYLKEWIGDWKFITITHANGSTVQKFKWFKYHYELNYSQFIDPIDQDDIIAILEGFLDDSTIVEVMPHIDMDGRKYDVLLAPGDLGVEVRGKNRTARNFGLIIRFFTTNGLTSLDWAQAAVPGEGTDFKPWGRRSVRIL